MWSAAGRWLIGGAAAVGVLVGVGLALAQTERWHPRAQTPADSPSAGRSTRVAPVHTDQALVLEVALVDPWSATRGLGGAAESLTTSGDVDAGGERAQAGSWATPVSDIVDPWRTVPAVARPVLEEIVDPWRGRGGHSGRVRVGELSELPEVVDPWGS